jgi:hypothetical protein
MPSTGLWRWYINITITILDIIHRPVFYLKDNVSETGFSFRPQVEPTNLGPKDGATLRLHALNWCFSRCPETEDSSTDWAQLSSFHLETEKESSLRNAVF